MGFKLCVGRQPPRAGSGYTGVTTLALPHALMQSNPDRSFKPVVRSVALPVRHAESSVVTGQALLSRQSPQEVRTFLSISAPGTEANLERKHGELSLAARFLPAASNQPFRAPDLVLGEQQVGGLVMGRGLSSVTTLQREPS